MQAGLPSQPTRVALRFALALSIALVCIGGAAVHAQSGPSLAPVTISAKANRDPVEKSYRKMIRGMDLFEKQHGLSPGGELRFKLLPRRRDTDMARIAMGIVGSNIALPVPLSPDNTFTLERNPQANDEDALVTPDRKAHSMTWRADIRTPGLPRGTRRLGDLRLECKVGMEAGLVSNSRTFLGTMAKALMDTPAYCDGMAPKYLFFADGPIFSVAMVAGQRREILAIDKLYGGASDDTSVMDDLPYCDCEVLLDRAYVLPLGDRSWPDDTLVEFETMEGP